MMRRLLPALVLASLFLLSPFTASAAEEHSLGLNDALTVVAQSRQEVALLFTDTSEADAEASAARVQGAADDMVVAIARYAPTQADPGASRRFTQLADRYDVRRLPAIVVLDADGRPMARIDDLPSTSAGLSEALASAQARRQARDAALQAAASATGLERARLLDRALQQVTPFELPFYMEQVEEIVRLDPWGEAGLRGRYAEALAARACDEAIQTRVYPMIDAGDLTGARAVLKEMASWPDLDLHDRQLLLAFKAQLLFTQGDRAGALAELQDALALAPEGEAADRVRAAIDQMGLAGE